MLHRILICSDFMTVGGIWIILQTYKVLDTLILLLEIYYQLEHRRYTLTCTYSGSSYNTNITGSWNTTIHQRHLIGVHAYYWIRLSVPSAPLPVLVVLKCTHRVSSAFVFSLIIGLCFSASCKWELAFLVIKNAAFDSSNTCWLSSHLKDRCILRLQNVFLILASQ